MNINEKNNSVIHIFLIDIHFFKVSEISISFIIIILLCVIITNAVVLSLVLF